MNPLLHTRPRADLAKMPISDALNSDEQVTIGDLHANSMLLIYFLIAQGKIELSAEEYNQLDRLYQKATLSKEDIAEFNKIIEGMRILDRNLVRLIGDEIADRGSNDYFIFKILNKLHHSGVAFEILLSNHSIEFLTPYEKGQKWHSPRFGIEYSRSLENMRQLIEQGIISEEEVRECIETAYLPHLKLLSYSLDEEGICIYSHAGIDLEVIKALANQFKDLGVVYQDDTKEELANTIDAINLAFSQYVKNKAIHTLPKNLKTEEAYEHDPVSFILWNRKYGNLNRIKNHKGYTIHYVHGHDQEYTKEDHIICLDGFFGKGSFTVGQYLVLVARHIGKLFQPTPEIKPKTEKKTANKAEKKGAIRIAAQEFNNLLATLKDKANSFPVYSAAYFAAMHLHRTLKAEKTQLSKDHNLDRFRSSAHRAIEESRLVLEKHRGWSEFLANLLLGVATVGLGLLLKGVINKCNYRPFFYVHQTDSGKLLGDLRHSVDEVSLYSL